MEAMCHVSKISFLPISPAQAASWQKDPYAAVHFGGVLKFLAQLRAYYISAVIGSHFLHTLFQEDRKSVV